MAMAMTASRDRQDASPFLRAAAVECPPDFIALAQNIEPRPVAFVRATGRANLETARDAFAAGLAQPILIGEADQIAADAAAIGWARPAANASRAVSRLALPVARTKATGRGSTF